MNEQSIPVISLKNDPYEVAQEIKKANETLGFFIIIDHQIAEDLTSEMWKECFQFWNRVPQSILVNNISSSPFIWLDYSPNEISEKTSWIIGPTAGRQGMPWQPDTSQMRKLWTNYYQEMEKLLHTIMEYFAIALELDRDYFENKLDNHKSPMRTVYYPPVSADKLKNSENQENNYERAGEHTDWGCVTILLPDKNTSGLEIKLANGLWVSVPNVENGFVINLGTIFSPSFFHFDILGDLMPRWTNNAWKATPHRVTATPEQMAHGRLTIPFFGLVNTSTLLECIPSCCKDGKSQFEPILAGEFFSEHEKYSIYNK